MPEACTIERSSKRLIRRLLVLLVLCSVLGTGEAADAQTIRTDSKKTGWISVPGNSVDVGISPAGIVYAVATDGRIWRWGSILGEEWRQIPGSGFARVDVDETNKPWAVTKTDELLFYNGLYWEGRGQDFTDVGAGSDGTVMAIDKDGNLHRWDNKKREMLPALKANARRVDIDNAGNPWIVGEDGSTRFYENGAWTDVPGKMRDISVSPKGFVFGVSESDEMLFWEKARQNWLRVTNIQDVTALSVGPNSKPWLVLKDGRILASDLFQQQRQQEIAQRKNFGPKPKIKKTKAQRRNQSVDASTIPLKATLKFVPVQGEASDIGIGADGSVFAISVLGTNVFKYSADQSKFIAFPGELKRVTAGGDGNPWGVNGRGEVYRHTGVDWIQVKGISSAVDIDRNERGDVFATSTDNEVYKYNKASGIFNEVLGLKGEHIAVTPDGYPWTVAKNGQITRCDKTGCRRAPLFAVDIAIGPDGSIFVASDHNLLLTFNAQTQTFERVEGVMAVRLDVGPRGVPWVIDAQGKIFAAGFFKRDERRDKTIVASTQKRTTTSSKPVFTFTKRLKFETVNNVTATALSMSVGGDGILHTLINAGTFQRRENSNRDIFETISLPNGATAQVFAVDNVGRIVAIDNNGNLLRQKKVGGSSFQTLTSVSNLSGGYGATNLAFCGFPTAAKIDLAIGADGSMFYISPGAVLYKFNESRKTFEVFDSQTIFRRVAVAPDGTPWIVDTDQRIRIYNGSKFELLNDSTEFEQIAIGADGTPYACAEASTNSTLSDRLVRFNRTNNRFDTTTTECTCVTVGPEGRPVVAEEAGGFLDDVKELKD